MVAVKRTGAAKLAPDCAYDKKLAPEDAWIANLDIAGFRQEVRDLGDELQAGQGEEDVAHLNKIIMWSNIGSGVGIVAAGLPWWYLFPSIFLSLGIFSRWTMVAHHTCHGGYDKCHPDKGRFNRFKFAVGSFFRRFFDWFDWMLPEAWNVEHNNLHHYHLGEDSDPDLVERNTASIRAEKNVLKKYAAVTFLALTWKWFYYSPNTFKELKIKEMKKAGKPMPEDGAEDWGEGLTLSNMLSPGFMPSWFSRTEYLTRVFLPYLVYRFMVLPLPWLFIGGELGYGSALFKNAVINMVIADVATNLHGFVAIVTNHAGDDLYRFKKHCKPKSGEFYIRQVVSSADFAAGDDVTDFMHGWLNYQIEHHLWPDLSMLSYQRSMPKVKAICKKYGVPYVQQSVWTRLSKTVDIMTGNSSMRQYPIEYENIEVLAGAE